MASADVVAKVEAGFDKLQSASDCKSLLKKYLTKEVVDTCKDKKTGLGATLQDVIQSGVENLNSQVGVYAPDAEAYTVFAPLFDPIIAECHQGFKATDVQPPTDWGEERVAEMPDLDPEVEMGKPAIVVSTRIRVARSLEGYAFNPCLTEANYMEMQEKVSAALQTVAEPELTGTYYPLEGMGKEVQQQLIADHFLFKEGDKNLKAANACRFWPKGRGIFHNDDKTFLVWLGEEDHLRIISMQKGGNVGDVLRRLIKGVNAISAKAPFSRHERLGWLTSCPTNLGTTVRASVHVKLPLARQHPDFNRWLDQEALVVRGEDGETDRVKSKDDTPDRKLDLSLGQRMGKTEKDLIDKWAQAIGTIVHWERVAEVHEAAHGPGSSQSIKMLTDRAEAAVPDDEVFPPDPSDAPREARKEDPSTS